MLKVLAGDLSATFNLDGGHLKRYRRRRTSIIRSLCDQLILHDQILIPTNDYLTAAGLITLLGERNTISLLESDRLRFVRLRGIFGYARGTGPDGGLITFSDPNKRKPQDSPIEDSARAALAEIKGDFLDGDQLVRLIVQQSLELETGKVVDAIRMDAHADLQQTTLWKESYRYFKPGLLALPGLNEMQVRVLGPNTNAASDPVNALLALGLMNMELYLSENLGCTSTSTGSPIADCVALKLPRLDRDHAARPHLWSFLEIAGVPDLSESLLANRDQMAEFMNLTQNSEAQQFREWFHSNAELSEREILQRYMDLLHQVPIVQRGAAKTLRLAFTNAVGLIPVVGPAAGIAASAIDTYVVDRFLSGRSPKFFIERMRDFSGRIRPRE